MKLVLIMTILLTGATERLGVMRSERDCLIVASFLNSGERSRAERDEVPPSFKWECLP